MKLLKHTNNKLIYAELSCTYFPTLSLKVSFVPYLLYKAACNALSSVEKQQNSSNKKQRNIKM